MGDLSSSVSKADPRARVQGLWAPEGGLDGAEPPMLRLHRLQELGGCRGGVQGNEWRVSVLVCVGVLIVKFV